LLHLITFPRQLFVYHTQNRGMCAQLFLLITLGGMAQVQLAQLIMQIALPVWRHLWGTGSKSRSNCYVLKLSTPELRRSVISPGFLIENAKRLIDTESPCLYTFLRHLDPCTVVSLCIVSPKFSKIALCSFTQSMSYILFDKDIFLDDVG
jgi:hypothetical protein